MLPGVSTRQADCGEGDGTESDADTIEFAEWAEARLRQIREYVDERLKGACIHCGGWLSKTNKSRDHVPSKSLLRKPYPDNLPVVEICRACNSRFGKDEEYAAAFLGAVLAGSTEPHRQRGPVGRGILLRNEQLRSSIERAKTEFRTIGETRTVWTPDARRFEQVIVKNARGHVYFEFGEPVFDEPTNVMARPLIGLTEEERAIFELADAGPGWPEVGSRMLTRVVEGQDLSNGWVVVQEGVYRYAVTQTGAFVVKMVMAEYLAAEVIWSDE